MNSHLFASHANPISFVFYEPSGLRNYKNTLHEDLKQGNKKIIEYSQRFDLNDVITVQLTSDVATVPILKAYLSKERQGAIVETVLLRNSVTRTGTEGTRYYFNYDIALDATCQNKTVYFFAEQDGEYLLSEPVLTEDLTTDLANHQILKIEYTNFDKFDTYVPDLSIDWENIGTTDNLLFFYIEAQNNDPSDLDESENLDGALQKVKIAASNTFGHVLKTGIVPVHMFRKLSLASSLDFFAVNGIEFIKDGAVDPETVGNTTSVQCSVKLFEKVATGINVDNLTVETMANVIQVDGETFTDQSGSFDVAIPTGYIYHCSIVRKTAGVSGVITIGSTVGGTDYCDAIMGQISDTSAHSFAAHDDSTHVYFNISGAGVKMTVYVQWMIKEYPS